LPTQAPWNQPSSGHRIAFVRDPDGYRIELIGE